VAEELVAVDSSHDPPAAGPLVSVIMIFLNAERFITSAIESVLAQTYAAWELVLVDDGSTDGSSAIARRFAQLQPARIRLVEHEGHANRGMSASRNLGLRQARGAYIALLDADDIYLPEKLERQVAILQAQPEAAMVYGATLHWFSWTAQPAGGRADFHRKLGVEPNTLIRPPRLVTLFLRHEAWPPGTCGVLIRRAACERVGGFEEAFRGMFEDQVFFYKLCLSEPVFVEGGSWDRYRQHPGSHSDAMLRSGEWNTARDKTNSARRRFLDWLDAYLAEHACHDLELRHELRRELLPYRHPYRHRIRGATRRLLGS
jgi:glycosyltransferase involved in cell wall biosynthesis